MLIRVSFVRSSCCMSAVFLSASWASAADAEFRRDVQPILTEHCLQCHGADEGQRQSELRLDLRDSALLGGDSGKKAVVPGKPEESELLRRITSADADVVMPPPHLNKPLSSPQIETLRQWISDGADYESHWAFTAPAKISLPDGGADHPVDVLVLERLRREQLVPSKRGTDSEVCRRIYLDLIGLPPTPQELSDFASAGPESTIDTLLASERFGEKWARHWLDLARYSDTNGYEKDMQREQWAWRDWVIDAINRDMPHDQFIVEQIAGDLLPNATQQQVIATGFLRNSMINEEGAIVPEQFRMVEMFDRIDCIGKAVIGVSVQCAQCHTHKFDPITHDEYYGMFAFLNNSYEAQSWVYTAEQMQQIADVGDRIAAAEERIRSDRSEWTTQLSAWEAAEFSRRITWEPIEATELGTISGLNHPTQESDRSLLMKGHSSGDVFVIAAPKLKGVTGLRLETLTHRDLPQTGPGRSRNGTWVMNEIEVFVQKPDGTEWEKRKLVNASADFSEPEQKQPDGKKITGPVAHLIDGSDETSWNADRGVGQRNQPGVAVMQFEQPLELPEGSLIKIAWRMGDMLGCCRWSLTTSRSPSAPAADHAAVLAMEVAPADRTREQVRALFTAWRKSVPELQPVNDEIEALWKSLPVASTSILHMAEREPARLRVTHMLDRGGWDQPLQSVEAHTPAALNPFPADAPRNRLGFAKWLTDPRSPLTARVAVNQIWQAMFGTGLVETSEDFGTRAPLPEFLDLLDWLAVDFMEHGWSRKHLIRTIVTSASYQQSSAATPELLERDPRNRLLARGPRFRADAEVVRDIALSVSGLMTHRIGGPGIIPPVPQNVLDYNFVYPSYWTPAEGTERYRRAVYGFRKRSMPDPVMSSFDSPNGDLSCARRVRSNTPLAALTGLNEIIFVEAARAMALRVLREAGSDDHQRAEYAFMLCTSRVPSETERQEILTLLASRRQRLADGWLNPREVISGDPAQLPELPLDITPQDAAAWTLVSRVLLNLDETMSKN